MWGEEGGKSSWRVVVEVRGGVSSQWWLGEGGGCPVLLLDLWVSSLYTILPKSILLILTLNLP